MSGVPTLPGDQTAPDNACDWARISAINLVLVARGSQYDKGTLDASGTRHLPTNTARNSPDPVNAPTWQGAAAASITLGPDTAIDEQWKHYRYRVFRR